MSDEYDTTPERDPEDDDLLRAFRGTARKAPRIKVDEITDPEAAAVARAFLDRPQKEH